MEAKWLTRRPSRLFWHILRTTSEMDNRSCQKTLFSHFFRAEKHSGADSAWKHASGHATSIFSSDTTIRGGELWKIVSAASKRNTYVNVLKQLAWS